MRRRYAKGDAVEESDLVARAVRRDASAVSAITTLYNRRLFRIARSILGGDDEAEDVLQAAYLKAFGSLAQFRQECSLGTWLTRIVMNEALAVVRRRRPVAPFDEANLRAGGAEVISFPGSGAAVDPERTMAQRQIQTALEEAIDDLPGLFRTVLVARVLEDMSVEETADLLGLRPETVKTRLHRARRLLREGLERRVGPVLVNAFPFDGWRCRRMTTAVLGALGLTS